LLIILTFTNAQAFELSDNIAYPTLYEISLTTSVTINADVELSQHDTFTVYLFDTLSISDNNISHDAHSTAPEDLMYPSIQSDHRYISECNIDAITELYAERQTSQVVCEK